MSKLVLKKKEKNKFSLRGFQSFWRFRWNSTGQFNIPRDLSRFLPRRQLQEGVDYTVNYQAGRVMILDENLKNSNTPIDISPSNFLISKRFSGINIEHKFNDNFFVGGSLMNLSERSITQKANYGVEPQIRMLGLNVFYLRFSYNRLLNKLLNKTNVPSVIFKGVGLFTCL